MNKIKSIYAHEILDSRGNPTLEVEVILENGITGKAAVPSGASVGAYEALELRDKDPKRYNGKGVLAACRNVNTEIVQKLKKADVTVQRKIDKMLIALDGTTNKSRLGANAILGVSLACARAAARTQNLKLYEWIARLFQAKTLELPNPMMNILNGGKHAPGGLDIQEFMIVPKVNKFSEKVRCGAEIFHTLKDILKQEGYALGVGDEGGFAP
ncbi:MAG TPA: phosphopyruvate hydratase, partial [Candidatus Aenigmarchaeota archaeon]|nr:phosphopyruvate hydratase [Candidatus Aenigmarchaeota archaeon]